MDWNSFWKNGDWTEFLVPGGRELVNAFSSLDLSGKQAAQNQFTNQLYLDNSARAFSSQEAEKQRAWEEYMSNTQTQRAVADIKAAGLNPWLALQNSGFAGNTPQGSSASSSSGSASRADNKIAMAAGLIATALRVFLAKK